MRRGETAKYVQQLRCMGDLYEAFDLFAGALAKRCAQAPALPPDAGLSSTRRSGGHLCACKTLLCDVSLCVRLTMHGGADAPSEAGQQSSLELWHTRRLTAALLRGACRAGGLVGTDGCAELALRRARELRALCARGLEQLPPAQRTRPLSDTHLALCDPDLCSTCLARQPWCRCTLHAHVECNTSSA